MNLTAFLAENAIKPESTFYVVSPRFLSEEQDEQGKPLPMRWEIKPITSEEDEEIRRESTRRVLVPGKKNLYQSETDVNLYTGKLAAACTAFPNLHDKALQDSYHVKSAEALLKRMLTPGEYANYVMKIQEVCGFDIALQDEVDEAKN